MIARFDRSNRNPSPLLGVVLSVLAAGVALTGAVRGQESPVAPSQPEVREPAGVSPAPVAAPSADAPPVATVPPPAPLRGITAEEAAEINSRRFALPQPLGMPYVRGGTYGAAPGPYYPGMPGGRGGAMGMPGYPGYPYSVMPGGGGRAAPAGRVEEPSARRADAQAAEALRKSLPVQFDNVPLEDALRNVADSTGVDVIVDAKSLETAGVDRNAPVTLTLRQGAPAEQILTWLLRSAGGDAIGYALDHGVVIVASQDRIEQMVITRAYPVEANEDGNGVAELVRDTISPQSWREYGGAGTVRFFGRQLFVTATEPTHRQVERLLGLVDGHGAGVPAGGRGMMPGMPGGIRPGMAGAPAPAAPRPGQAR